MLAIKLFRELHSHTYFSSLPYRSSDLV